MKVYVIIETDNEGVYQSSEVIADEYAADARAVRATYSTTISRSTTYDENENAHVIAEKAVVRHD